MTKHLQNMLPSHELRAPDISVDDVVRLADTRSTWCVSLYLPTHVGGRDVNQDPIRFRNLISDAETELPAEAAALPATARALVDDAEFWAHGSAGLGVLIDEHAMTLIRLNDPVDELAVVSDRFHLKPLLPAVADNLVFDVLALSQHSVRVVHGSRSGGTEVVVRDMPTSISEALFWDDRERQLQSHAAGRVGRDRVTAAFHGQGAGKSTRTSDIRRYLQAIDHAVVRHRGNSPVPLVLAGVDELVADYRAITRCHHVVDDHIAGNPDQIHANVLAERAWPLVAPLGQSEEERAREAFGAGAARTLDTVEQALVAAAAGHVESIFVPVDEELWGRYTPGSKTLVEHDERRPGDHDLGDVAALETLRHGGRAFAVPAADIPGAGTTAAILRFA